ncbi:MAG: DoxX family protein, partial [Actinomycetota bacterium]|nr:DoxX family protein [Actinomycetota bacterium]
VSVLLAATVAASGVGKLSKQPKLIESLTGLGVPMSWIPRLAAAELAGAVGLVAGLWVAPLGIAAAAGLVAYFVGAVVTHVKADDREVFPASVLALVSIAALVLRALTM